MFTFTLSQSMWEFGKSRVIRAMRARGLRANVPSACQLPIFTCQRAKGVPIIQLGIHRGIGVPIFQFHLLKGLPIFQTFFKRTFQLLNFSIMLNICKFQEYLGISRKLISETKNSNFDICKISLRENLVSLKPLTSFSMVHLRLTE